jgi:hypothetical protein
MWQEGATFSSDIFRVLKRISFRRVSRCHSHRSRIEVHTWFEGWGAWPMALDELELLFQWLQDEWLWLIFSDRMWLLRGTYLIPKLLNQAHIQLKSRYRSLIQAGSSWDDLFKWWIRPFIIEMPSWWEIWHRIDGVKAWERLQPVLLYCWKYLIWIRFLIKKDWVVVVLNWWEAQVHRHQSVRKVYTARLDGLFVIKPPPNPLHGAHTWAAIYVKC